VRAAVKTALRVLALVAVSPALASFWVKRLIIGGDRALVGSTQALSLIPGLTGQYLRRAFLSRTIAFCSPSAVIEFGVLLSQTGARIDDSAYIGPRCHLGLVHVGANVMLAAGVHIPSGARLHGMELGVSMREQKTTPATVVIGRGAWIGSNAVVMADVGADSIVGAGAVVTQPIPPGVVAGGVPARVLKQRVADADRP
jgi:virginiamycin A acetyltransferase